MKSNLEKFKCYVESLGNHSFEIDNGGLDVIVIRKNKSKPFNISFSIAESYGYHPNFLETLNNKDVLFFSCTY